MATSIASLFSGVKGIDDSTLNAFKTPEQVREEQLSKLRERSSAQATLLGNLGQRGTTALPGIIGSFAASQLPEQAVDLNQAARRGMLGLGQIAGATGRTGVQEALQQAAVSPEERQAGATQEAMRQLKDSSPEEMMAVARELQKRGNTQGAQALMQMARAAQLQAAELQTETAKQETEAVRQAKMAKETEMLGQMTPKEVADLYKYFSSDSIDSYLQGTGQLVPLNENDRKALSTYGKQLSDAGYEPGTPEYEAQMRVYNQKDLESKGQIKTINVMTPMEQVSFLKDSIESDPLFKSATVREDKINIAQAALPEARRGSAEGITTLQRTLSDLFNSDTRAASEIERFVSGNKSLLRAFNDLLSRKIYGELSTTELENYEQILKAVTDATNKQRADVLDKNIQLFNTDLSPDAVERIKNEYGQNVGVQDNDPLSIR